ncbi:unnamed protein product [Nippostrongylus brasiliensis]|uniref:Urotensin-2B n=1 Tax=Nippostrongylus brasiliensis TaxID=27835 RepID=A0A0N4YCK6_NIPBR|nr:unnamed protein product [Nippostrongylus brasiliensis]
MRSGRSSCPGLLSSAVLILLLLHTLYSILYAPPIFPNSKAMFSFKFVPRHFSWYILTRDDSYVLVDDLLQDLSAFDADESYMAVIGAKSLQDAFSSLSDSLISLHNLTLADMRIFDLLLNRIKVLPQL